MEEKQKIKEVNKDLVSEIEKYVAVIDHCTTKFGQFTAKNRNTFPTAPSTVYQRKKQNKI